MRFLSASVVVFALLGFVRAWDYTNAQASVRVPTSMVATHSVTSLAGTGVVSSRDGAPSVSQAVWSEPATLTDSEREGESADQSGLARGAGSLFGGGSGGTRPVSAATSRSEMTSRAASRAAIRRVFGWGAQGDRAVRVSWCEARWYARTVSPTDDWGLFALHRSVWDPARNPAARPYWPRGKDWSDVLDPYVNARVAWAISRRGTDFWTHWRWSAGCWA